MKSFTHNRPLAPALLFAAFLLPCLETWLYIAKGKVAAPVLSTVPSFSINGEDSVDIDSGSHHAHTHEDVPLLRLDVVCECLVVMFGRAAATLAVAIADHHDTSSINDQYLTPPESTSITITHKLTHPTADEEAMQHHVGRHHHHHHAPRMSAEEVGWRQKVKASMAEVLRMATVDDGWKFVTDKKGVRGAWCEMM